MKPNDTIENIYFYQDDNLKKCGLSGFGAGDDRDILISTKCRNVKNDTIIDNNISMGKYLFIPSKTFFVRRDKMKFAPELTFRD
jgi:hypothetical protein